MRPRIIFITGTDTGVGKTVLAGLLLSHLRASGCQALAIKPFCSGSRADVDLLRAIQDRQLTREEMNPYYFAEPVAPLVASRKHRRKIQLNGVLAHISQIAAGCECLLIEGAGGLLVPLGAGFTTLDLISRLRCDVLIVSTNKLGTINHTLLTVQALRQAGTGLSRSGYLKVVLMNRRFNDPSCSSNAQVLAEFLPSVPILGLAFLGHACRSQAVIKSASKNFQKSLARILE